MESRRPDAIFRDPFAERLAGPDGSAIVAKLPRGRATAWAMIVRTAVFDEIILTRVREHSADLVLNLAAGLDARPWRLPLPPSLRWVDVDLPGLAAAPSFRWWLIDLASPRLLKYMNRTWGRTLDSGNASFRFAPADGSGFFRPFGWHELSFRSSGDEAHRLRREMRLMWLWRFIARLSSTARQEEFRRMAGFVLLGREPDDAGAI